MESSTKEQVPHEESKSVPKEVLVESPEQKPEDMADFTKEQKESLLEAQKTRKQ
jgi:hypothetical protein